MSRVCDAFWYYDELYYICIVAMYIIRLPCFCSPDE